MAYVSIDMVVCWVEEKIFEMRVAPIPSYAADGYARDVISKEYGKICEKYGVEPSSQDNFNVTSGSFTVGRGINKTKKIRL